jgi:cell division protein FtsW
MLARGLRTASAAPPRPLSGGARVEPRGPARAVRSAAIRRLRAALFGLLAGLFLFLMAALVRAPQAWLPANLTLRLQPGDSVSLEPLAGVTVSRDSAGRWLLAAPGGLEATPLILRDGIAPQSLGSMPLPPSFLTFPGGHRIARQPSSDGNTAFEFDGSTWHYDGATLLRDGQAQASCPDARWTVRLAGWWNGIAPHPLTLARPLSLGGNLHCGNRIGIAGVLPDAAAISRSRGELRITDLDHTPRALDGAQAIVVGPMRLALGEGGASAGHGALTLYPQRRVPWFSSPEVALPRGVEWRWQLRELWPALPRGALQTAFTATLYGSALAMLATLAIVAAPLRAGKTPASALSAAGAAALVAAGLCALVLQRAGQPPAAAYSLILAALAIIAWLRAPSALTPANACAALLLAAGLLLQQELGLGGLDLRYFHKTAALLATGLGTLALWRMAPAAWRTRLGTQRCVERILLALAAIALAALAAQVLWGDETGVFDMQPVELAKLALCALTAHCLALRFAWHDGPQSCSPLARWLALAAPVLLFLALLAAALVQVDDYSPLILLVLWAGAMALAYALSAGRRLLAALLLAAGTATACGVAALHQAGPGALPGSFYADRFQVWLAPGEHPHTGQQLLRAASAIAGGGLAGADSGFGMRSAGLPAGDAAAIPAVQDDFAPSFFLNRHGLLAGMALWFVQAAFLASLLWQAWRCHQRAAQARAYREAWYARFRCFALCGGTALVAGHLLLSWGTNLAILPVMGQPMSFLSAGGSHLLFFLLPLLGLSAASNEE